MGKITKQWSGLAKEYFTDADNFGIQCKFRLLVCVYMYMYMYVNVYMLHNNTCTLYKMYLYRCIVHVAVCMSSLVASTYTYCIYMYYFIAATPGIYMYMYVHVHVLCIHVVHVDSLPAVPMDLDVKMKAVMMGATFLIVRHLQIYDTSNLCSACVHVQYMYVHVCMPCGP